MSVQKPGLSEHIKLYTEFILHVLVKIDTTRPKKQELFIHLNLILLGDNIFVSFCYEIGQIMLLFCTRNWRVISPSFTDSQKYVKSLE